ncbi:MAG: SMP-30/gluconolactonase/LRE family protein [Cyanobacteria bacterium P01_F01_bin.150]
MSAINCGTAPDPQLKPVLTARARLGEGPVWDERSQLLYWVDIYNHRVHQFNPETGRNRFIDVGETVGAIALVESPNATDESDTTKLIMALRHGLAYLDLNTGDVIPIITVETDKLNNRFNDGKCDIRGRFWFGSMCNDGKKEGMLYRYISEHHNHGSHTSACCSNNEVSVTNEAKDPLAKSNLTSMESGLKISNGLGWSPDNQTFYLTDSPLQTIFAYDFDEENGTMGDRRVLIDLTHESFFPDGLTIDAEGCLWVAMWDGWCVVRFDPTGKEISRIQLPVQRPTSCAFGGRDLNQLYITTASIGLSEAQIEASLWSGDLFCVETTIKGLPMNRFIQL